MKSFKIFWNLGKGYLPKDTAAPELAGHKSPISYVPNSAASPRGCLGKEDLPKDTADPELAGHKSPISYVPISAASP